MSEYPVTSGSPDVFVSWYNGTFTQMWGGVEAFRTVA